MPEPVRETLIWGPFALALVPFALVWSGAGVGVALAVGGLLTLLGLLCWAAMSLSGVTLRSAHHHHDERR